MPVEARSGSGVSGTSHQGMLKNKKIKKLCVLRVSVVSYYFFKGENR